MLKNILFHLDEDETSQSQIEEAAAPDIQEALRQNLNAFQRYIPTIYHQLTQKTEHTSAIFCNKNSELNIVDQKSARVLYGAHPRAEIDSQLDYFLANAFRYDLSDCAPAPSATASTLNSPLADKMANASPLPPKASVVVVLGVGLGYHIQGLLEQVDIDHLIIYEPNVSYLRCSVSAMSWQHCLQLAKRKNTAIYFQLSKDGRDIARDIQELSEHENIDHFYLYKHYNHPVFNQIADALSRLNWPDFQQWALNIKKLDDVDNQVPFWTETTRLSQWSEANLDETRLQKNLKAFEHYYPDIFKEFKHYEPKTWRPLANADGQVNIFHVEAATPLYSNHPEAQCQQSIDGFSARPNKDGLVLGYKGRKLKRYLHYQLVEDVSTVLSGLEESHGSLPDDIKSMIVFGLGVGYQLPYLLASHTVQKLFICEPNRDYFYASLYAIDWESVLKTIDDADGRLYINIGDDGSHLISDLLTQFHSIGPYVLANTYFYQGYYNPILVSAVAKLREQLQVIIAMGDYFDHSKYCISHNRWALENQVPFLRQNAPACFTREQHEVPVFIVGNGPSLDGLLEIVKQEQDNAIIISCGTALQTLHRHNIVPDFHAEIEANRSTYDWAVRVDDPDYLKKVTLISCNGVHPDTCKLYKDTKLAFKQGESATVSVTEVFKDHPFALLAFAYPTVSNFVSDFVTSLGFSQIYLFGVDMGFVDEKYHHSKGSGYYHQNGKEAYNYAGDNDTSLLIEGNFRPYVKTKYEFKVAKTVMEETFSHRRGDIYNLNDGAKIAHTTPLSKDDVLIISLPELKQQTLDVIHQKAFLPFDASEFLPQFHKRYQHDALVEELDAFTRVLAKPVTTRVQAEHMINEQREFLVSSFMRKKSMLFFYMNGTLNFINSALSKTLNVDDDEKCLQAFNTMMEHWKVSFADIAGVLSNDEKGTDFIASFISQRRNLCLKRYAEACGVTFVCKDEAMAAHLEDVVHFHGIEKLIAPANNASTQCHHLIINTGESAQLSFSGDNRACVIYSDAEDFYADARENKNANLMLFLPGDFDQQEVPPQCNPYQRLYIAILGLTGSHKLRYILPKLDIDPAIQSVNDYYDLSFFAEGYVYESHDFIAITDERLTEEEVRMASGDLLRYLPVLRERHLCLRKLDVAMQAEEKQLIKQQYQRSEN